MPFSLADIEKYFSSQKYFDAYVLKCYYHSKPQNIMSRQIRLH